MRREGYKELSDLLLKTLKNQIPNLFASTAEERIQTLKTNKLLLENVFKLNLLGHLLKNMSYEESKKLYFTALLNLPEEKKVTARRLIHAKHTEKYR